MHGWGLRSSASFCSLSYSHYIQNIIYINIKQDRFIELEIPCHFEALL